LHSSPAFNSLFQNIMNVFPHEVDGVTAFDSDVPFHFISDGPMPSPSNESIYLDPETIPALRQLYEVPRHEAFNLRIRWDLERLRVFRSERSSIYQSINCASGIAHPSILTL